jgi:creatinine amidohydrolase
VKLPSRHWWDLTSAQFAATDMAQVVALQPVAAVEQHGPHLPVRVDAAINAGIVTRALDLLPDDLPLLVLPALPVGKSDEHLAYPGTLTLSYETLGRAWFEIGESVHRAGCRKMIFFNSHGGQPQLLDIVCRELRVRLGMFAVACSWFQVVGLSDLFEAAEIRHGIHAGAIETSVMRHLHPDLVDMAQARNFVSLSQRIERSNPVLRSEGSVGFGWQAQDLNPAGATGDASRGTSEAGEAILERAAAALAALAGDVHRYSLSNLNPTYAFAEPHTPRPKGSATPVST